MRSGTIAVGDPRRDPAVRNHFVYWFYDAAGVLLYVGCTMRPEARFRDHVSGDNRHWARSIAKIRAAGPYSFDTARRLEREAQIKGRPVHGRVPPLARVALAVA